MIIPRLFFLKEDEQLLVESFTRRWTVNGPKQYLAQPFQRIQRRNGILLGPTEYIRIRDRLTGVLHNEKGPKLYFLSTNEEVVQRLSAIALKKEQYVKLIDTQSGIVRVERGEKSVYLSPTEEVFEEIRDGVSIDDQTAVMVRDIGTGQLQLITEPQVFIPAPDQKIIEIRHRIRLEDHQILVIKDEAGRYIFKEGSNEDRSFFLEPHCEIVELLWSTGIHKDQRSLRIKSVDIRPKFMWYEFEARTQDNVELVLGVTFFWQIIDVKKMFKTTDDVPGDICSHARSSVIQAVSQVSLETFLASFNQIVRQAVIEAEDAFYDERGVRVHSIEMRSISCKDPATQRILQEIIQETTNRLNRLQKQESENEIKVRQINGQIEAETTKRKLIEAQRKNSEDLAEIEGHSEATRVKAFLDGADSQLSIEQKIAIFNTLRKNEVIKKLSEGTAQLYFTPADVDLSIETRQVTNPPQPTHR